MDLYQFLHWLDLYRENLRNLPAPSHKALAYQILHVALSSGPVLTVPKFWPSVGWVCVCVCVCVCGGGGGGGGGKDVSQVLHGLILHYENFRNLPVPIHKT